MKTLLRMDCIELSGFRRLQAVRIDFEEDTTVFVGANNSGKTAAISAIRRFFHDRGDFSPYDIGVENWASLRALGEIWESMQHDPAENETHIPWSDQLEQLNGVMPALDVWLDVQPGGFHYVSHVIPSLDWSGGRLGIRLRLEPAADVGELQRLAWSYRQVRTSAMTTAGNSKNSAKRAWPTDLLDYWLHHPRELGSLASYKLDPNKLVDVDSTFRAQPQKLFPKTTRHTEDLLKHVIRIDLIGAQRGLGTTEGNPSASHNNRTPGLFSNQLVKLADSMFDRTPFETEAQQKMQLAIAGAQDGLDEAVTDALKGVTTEVGTLGYPGLHDPKNLVFRSRVRTSDLLNHATAVQYSLEDGTDREAYLPEYAIGLGYQNLQTLKYKLYSFREERLAKSDGVLDAAPVPVHIVLVEEPEAHLHVQAQRVFVKRAYELLNSRQADSGLSTQLVISSHSSHLAHAVSFTKLRYFRRNTLAPRCVPDSAVVSLRGAFGPDKETEKFAERYLRVQHSDLLFADAAVFVEGAAERVLIPQIIENTWPNLANRYLSFIDIGGSHAHRFRPLVERLGLPTLIVTDLDAANETTNEKKRTKAAVDLTKPQVSTNPTITGWHPKEDSISSLLEMKDAAKETPVLSWPNVRIRIAFQVPSAKGRPCATSFEDAVVLENEAFFEALAKCKGPMEKVRKTVAGCKDSSALAIELHKILGDRFDKAAFALDLLFQIQDDATITCPKYIQDGLEWLDSCLSPSDSPTPPTPMSGARS